MSTLRDVANYAGISLSAASRMLSQDKTFKTTLATQKKLEEAVKALNYTYKSKARTHQFNIGCVLAVTSEKYSDPFFVSILNAAEEEGKKYGINISMIKAYNELKDERLLDAMCKSKLDGLLLMEELPESILNELRQNIKHIVGIDLCQSPFNNVGFDHYESSHQVVSHFIELGCKRIAYIGGSGPNSAFSDSQALVAYREVLRKANIALDESIVLNCDWDIDACANYTQELLSSQNPCDAIIAGSDTLASVILGKIYEMKLSCPNDVSVIGFNNLATAAHMIPPLTTVDVPTKEIGRVAIRRLYDLMNAKDSTKMNILLPTQLVIRNSTKEKEKR